MKKLLFFIMSVCLFSPVHALAGDATTFNPEDATSFNPIPIAIDAQQASVPIGTVITYATATPPEGYLACNGQVFNSAEYPKLAAVLGRNQVPDMRGMFVRGYDPSGFNDANGIGRGFASIQGDAIRNITGKFAPDEGWYSGGGHQAAGAMYMDGEYSNMPGSHGDKGRTPFLKFDASRVVPTANENRPKNINLLYAIKHD